MTAPVRDLHITPELVARFADYYRRHPETWGVLHVSFDDGNYGCQLTEWTTGTWTPEERVLVALHNRLSPSQRARLCKRALAAVLGVPPAKPTATLPRSRDP